MADTAIEGYPRGWFVVAFSGEIEQGKSKELRYFGRDLAAYRGDDGVVRVLDAHCPHMGAHLGCGGKVSGDSLSCPFHAWRFGPDGKCNLIPYATRIPAKAQLRSYPVVEKNGVVLVHFDPWGAAPTFEIPVIPEYGDEAWLPWSTAEYFIKTHPREIVDNLADKAHFPAVHKTDIKSFEFESDGHLATQRTSGLAYLAGGGTDDFSSTTTYHGPAFLLMRMSGVFDNVMLVCHTPIDENRLMLRMAIMLKIKHSRSATEGAMRGYLHNLKAGFEDDLHIWEKKIYRDPPMLCEGDGPIVLLRKWYRQFYRPSAVDGTAGTAGAAAHTA